MILKGHSYYDVIRRNDYMRMDSTQQSAGHSHVKFELYHAILT